MNNLHSKQYNGGYYCALFIRRQRKQLYLTNIPNITSAKYMSLQAMRTDLMSSIFLLSHKIIDGASKEESSW